jgi:ribosomal protein S18 acetylase RimI-like enzyme
MDLAMETLDNMFWHALTGPQQEFGEGSDLARRYLTEVTPFSALPDEYGIENFAALRDVVGPGGTATLFRGDVKLPANWEVLVQVDAVQMLARVNETLKVDSRVEVLGPDDVSSMLELTQREKPGPFLARTSELGVYLGVRSEGQLIAMAGQRAQTNEYVEISAVCTDGDFVGQGLARALVTAQIALISQVGRIPMLQASASNARAIAIYEDLGFRRRRTAQVTILRAPQ